MHRLARLALATGLTWSGSTAAVAASPPPPLPHRPAAPVATVADAYATMAAYLAHLSLLPSPGAVVPAAPPPPAPARPATPPPSLPASPSSPGESAAAQQMILLVNQARLQAGLSPYAVDPVLMRLAQKRAQALAQSGVFTHDLPGLGLPLAMEEAAGMHAWGMGAENLAEAANVSMAFLLLMASPLHRANLLSPTETRIGVGVAPIPGGVAICQLFAGPNLPARTPSPPGA